MNKLLNNGKNSAAPVKNNNAVIFKQKEKVGALKNWFYADHSIDNVYDIC